MKRIIIKIGNYANFANKLVLLALVMIICTGVISVHGYSESNEIEDEMYDEVVLNDNTIVNYSLLSTSEELWVGYSCDILNKIKSGQNLFHINNFNARFVNFSLLATANNGGTVTYSAGSLTIKNANGDVIQKIETNGYTNISAVNKNGINNLTAYLPSIGVYYIEINYPTDNLSSLQLLFKYGVE